MATESREERRLIRQRGAGARELKSATFGFTFGFFAPAPPQPPPSNNLSPSRRASPCRQAPVAEAENQENVATIPAVIAQTISSTVEEPVTIPAVESTIEVSGDTSKRHELQAEAPEKKTDDPPEEVPAILLNEKAIEPLSNISRKCGRKLKQTVAAQHAVDCEEGQGAVPNPGSNHGLAQEPVGNTRQRRKDIERALGEIELNIVNEQPHVAESTTPATRTKPIIDTESAIEAQISLDNSGHAAAMQKRRGRPPKAIPQKVPANETTGGTAAGISTEGLVVPSTACNVEIGETPPAAIGTHGPYNAKRKRGRPQKAADTGSEFLTPSTDTGPVPIEPSSATREDAKKADLDESHTVQVVVVKQKTKKPRKQHKVGVSLLDTISEGKLPGEPVAETYTTVSQLDDIGKRGRRGSTARSASIVQSALCEDEARLGATADPLETEAAPRAGRRQRPLAISVCQNIISETTQPRSVAKSTKPTRDSTAEEPKHQLPPPPEASAKPHISSIVTNSEDLVAHLQPNPPPRRRGRPPKQAVGAEQTVLPSMNMHEDIPKDVSDHAVQDEPAPCRPGRACKPTAGRLAELDEDNDVGMLMGPSRTVVSSKTAENATASDGKVTTEITTDVQQPKKLTRRGRPPKVAERQPASTGEEHEAVEDLPEGMSADTATLANDVLPETAMSVAQPRRVARRGRPPKVAEYQPAPPEDKQETVDALTEREPAESASLLNTLHLEKAMRAAKPKSIRRTKAPNKSEDALIQPPVTEVEVVPAAQIPDVKVDGTVVAVKKTRTGKRSAKARLLENALPETEEVQTKPAESQALAELSVPVESTSTKSHGRGRPKAATKPMSSVEPLPSNDNQNQPERSVNDATAEGTAKPIKTKHELNLAAYPAESRNLPDRLLSDATAEDVAKPLRAKRRAKPATDSVEPSFEPYPPPAISAIIDLISPLPTNLPLPASPQHPAPLRPRSTNLPSPSKQRALGKLTLQNRPRTATGEAHAHAQTGPQKFASKPSRAFPVFLSGATRSRNENDGKKMVFARAEGDWQKEDWFEPRLPGKFVR